MRAGETGTARDQGSERDGGGAESHGGVRVTRCRRPVERAYSQGRGAGGSGGRVWLARRDRNRFYVNYGVK